MKVKVLHALTIMLTLAGTLAACSQVAADPRVAQDVSAQIDPAIQGADRIALTEYMARLSPAWRDNVILITAEGRILSNRPQLKTLFKTGRQLSGNRLLRDDGTALAGTPQVETRATDVGIVRPQLLPQCTGAGPGTGPFRRIATSNGANFGSVAQFRYAGANAYLVKEDFGLNNKIKYSSGETPYVYLGGTGATYGTGLRTAVDAGYLYFKNATYPSGGWELFIRVERDATWAYGGVLTPNQVVKAEFLVDANDHVTFRSTGSVAPGSSTGLTIGKTAMGWRADGVGNSMKRMVSIAQNAENLGPKDTYLLGIEWTYAQLSKNDPNVSTTGLHNWGMFATDVAENCAYTPTKVISTETSELMYDPANELVNIDLR